MHSRDLLKGGLPVEYLVLVAVWPEAGGIFDEQERAALAWAETVTRLGDQGVPDSAFAAAAEVFGEKQLADLTIAIGLMSAYNRLAIGFRATPEGASASALINPRPHLKHKRGQHEDDSYHGGSGADCRERFGASRDTGTTTRRNQAHRSPAAGSRRI
jgi:hypothetical protein